MEQRLAFGSDLRGRRERLSLDIAGLAQSTRINRPFIEALESGEFERLPGQVFGRGFLRSIGKALQLDEPQIQALIESFDACWAPGPQVTPLKIQIKNKPYPAAGERLSAAVQKLLPNRRTAMIAALGVAALGVVFIGARAWPRLSAKIATMTEAPEATAVVAIETAPAMDLPAVGAASVVSSEAPADPVGAASPEPVPAAVTTEAVPKPPVAVVAEVAPKAPAEDVVSKTASNTTPAVVDGEQMLELVVTETVRVRLDVDSAQAVTRELAPQTYRFSFKDRADLLIYDAAALKISFNGRQLGPLGSKGRVRRLSFQAASTDAKNL